MQKLQRIGFIGLIVLLAAGAFWYLSGENPEPRKQEGSAVSREEPVSEGGPAIHPVSLQAMIMDEYDGQNLTLGRVLADNAAYTRYYITYESGGLTISGIMNVPKGAGPFPLLILNHGYIDPTVYTNGRGLRREQDYLARRGYVVMHPDYRNHADSSKDEENDVRFRLGYTEDVIGAVLAARNSGLEFIDADRVGMLGHSMGGGITQNVLVVRPELVDAAVLFAPVSSDQRDNYDKWLARRPETASEILARFGHYEDNPVFWDNISANTFFDRVKTPVMIHHGTADESVPLQWSQRLNSELMTAGKDSVLHIYPDEPHEFIAAWGQVMQRSLEFFDQHLK